MFSYQSYHPFLRYIFSLKDIEIITDTNNPNHIFSFSYYGLSYYCVCVYFIVGSEDLCIENMRN